MNERRPNIIALPGDGIGPEVIGQAIRVIEWFTRHRGFDCDLVMGEFGVGEWHRTGRFMRDELRADLLSASAVLFGAMGGGAEHHEIPQDVRRNEGLLRVRKDMGVFANLRPVKVYSAMENGSAVKAEVVRGVDFMIVRELLGGIYFGEPRGIEMLGDGQRRGYNTQVYTTKEVERIGRVAFEIASHRAGRVTSVDKANVMESGTVWRDEIIRLQASDYPNVTLDHMYVDNCSMQIIRAPRAFDVLVTDNLFGDILSDCAATIAGSLGMLPSASLGDVAGEGHRKGLYEPAHGSAPDIAGQNKANPIATILSFGMALEMAFGRRDDAVLLDRAVGAVLADNKRTLDIATPDAQIVSTVGMGDAVLAALDRQIGRA
jgi:3-isopropylmalate dehydrogenase